MLKFSQRRDSGWIHTCLEEAENERMHLMFVPLNVNACSDGSFEGPL